MPEQETIDQAREDAREGKSPSTQAGEFVREEIHHIREGKHGAASPKQAIAIGLSKARRAGVKLPPPKGSASLRKKAEQDEEAGEHPRHRVSQRGRAPPSARSNANRAARPANRNSRDKPRVLLPSGASPIVAGPPQKRLVLARAGDLQIWKRHSSVVTSDR
jgi:hypothetical protein